MICFDRLNGLTPAFETYDGPDGVPFCSETTKCQQRLGTNYVCGKNLNSQKWNLENFDTFGNSLLLVYQIISLEGWSDIMYVSFETFSVSIFIYYWLIVIIGAFYLMSLIIAILGNEFEKSQQKIKEGDQNRIREQLLE